MQKSKQFISAATLGGVGIILTAVGRFSASADQLIPASTTLTVVMVIGLILLLAAAFWFYRLASKK